MTDQKTITISILIPVYNVTLYLDECLQSILAQIDERAEIIIMNDGSTDNSWEISQKYADHAQITLTQAPHNRGLSATRNELLKLANHEYIWFIDSDDVMHDGAYQLVMNQLQQTPVDVLFGDYIAWRGDYKRQKSGFVGKPNQYYTNDNASFFKDLVKSNSNYAWNKIFKKSVIDNVAFQMGLKFEDIYYMSDLSKFVKDFWYCQSPFIDYREREGSIIQILDKQYVTDYLNVYIYREQIWHELLADMGKTAQQDEFSIYLWYKTFNRFTNLVKKVKKAQEYALLDIIKIDYLSIYLDYYKKVKNKLSLFKKIRLCYQYWQVLNLLKIK